MQIQPFWAKIVGETSSDLFNVKTNLRLGCAILRSYLDIDTVMSTVRLNVTMAA